MLTRFPNWPERLDAVLRDNNRPFQWGVNDCALRACDVVLAITGTDVAAEFRGRYTTRVGATRVMRRLYGGNLERVAEKIAAAHGMPEIPPALARRGDVVLVDTDHGPSLGVMRHDGRHAEFKTDTQPLIFPAGDCRRAWRV